MSCTVSTKCRPVRTSKLGHQVKGGLFRFRNEPPDNCFVFVTIQFSGYFRVIAAGRAVSAI